MTATMKSLIHEINTTDTYGYFTANLDNAPIVACIKAYKTDDEELNEDGINHYYVVKHPDLFDAFIWSDEELIKYIEAHKWAWTFHKKEVA